MKGISQTSSACGANVPACRSLQAACRHHHPSICSQRSLPQASTLCVQGQQPQPQLRGSRQGARGSGVCCRQGGGDVEFEEDVPLQDKERFEQIAAALVARLPSVMEGEEDEEGGQTLV